MEPIKTITMNLLEPRECLVLDQAEIISLWDQGFLNDLAYITLLLKFQYQNAWANRIETTGEISIRLTDQDLDWICEEWRGRSLDRRPKYLSRSKIFDLISKMSKANQSSLLVGELTLLCAQEILGIDPSPGADLDFPPPPQTICDPEEALPDDPE